MSGPTTPTSCSLARLLCSMPCGCIARDGAVAQGDAVAAVASHATAKAGGIARDGAVADTEHASAVAEHEHATAPAATGRIAREGAVGDGAVAENPNSRTDSIDTIDTLNSKSLLANTDTLDRLDNSGSQCTHFSTDSVDTLDDAFLESPSVSPDSPDIVCRTSALSVLDQAHPENFPAVSDFVAKPESACPSCRSGQWWQLPGQIWHCRTCEPNMPPTATTLTLPCHKAQVPRVGSNAGFERMIKIAGGG